MPNLFKPTTGTLPVSASEAMFEPITKGKPGIITRWRLRNSVDKARLNVQQAAIEAIENEALSITKNAVEAQGQETRAEHARVHAQVLAAIGNELTANASAGFQAIGATRFAGTLTNFANRREWLAEIDRMAVAGKLDAADRQALVDTARAVHMDVEGRQDAVYEGAVAMVARAYDAACATTKQIIAR